MVMNCNVFTVMHCCQPLHCRFTLDFILTEVVKYLMKVLPICNSVLCSAVLVTVLSVCHGLVGPHQRRYCPLGSVAGYALYPDHLRCNYVCS